MKKYISIIICLVLAVLMFASCGENTAKTSGGIKIVTTIFPEYDWARNITGGKADITMLLDNGVDLHSYQPTADDIIKISTCDVFIYVGGNSDRWVKDTLAQATNKDMTVINLIEALGESVKEEETKEGMQPEQEEENEESTEYDEHVWLSLKNASVLCRYICDKLCAKDPANAESYEQNTSDYIKSLKEVDLKYQQAVDGAAKKTIVFGDRFPFRYLVDDYGLDYYAAFTGCSAETEASFETIMFLANKIDTLGIKAILQIETSDGSISEAIKKSTKTKKQAVLSVNSMQSTTSKDVDAGASYISIMEKNLDVLKKALG